MVFDVCDRLAQPGGRAVCEVDDAPPDGVGVTCLGRVSGRVELTNVGREVVARGRLAVTVELQCTRCLRTFQQAVVAEIEEPCSLQEIDDLTSYAVASDEPEALPILEGNESTSASWCGRT
jgi:uncharacterized metal-binding protein YceD (DUF177 family)